MSKVQVKLSSGISVSVRKEKTDPLCLRASIGGSKDIGYYLVYRGDSNAEIEAMLEAALTAFKNAKNMIDEKNRTGEVDR